MDAEHPPTTPPAAAAAAAAADTLFVGIDVAKDKLDLARSGSGAGAAAAADDGRVETFANDPAGIARVVEGLAAAAPRPATIVVESTGGLERPLVDALLGAGLPVALVHPGRVRSFAKGLGVLAKTDRIDARVLARFGRLAAPRLARRRTANQAELQALVVCRRQLAATRAQQANRLGATASRAARKAIDKVIATLDRQVDALDKEIGALAGVAPFNREPGRADGRRAIRGGRTAVRCVPYMATIAAIRCNPVIRAFSDRLRAGGKASKVRIVACMRKLLTLLNAMARNGLRWDQLDVVRKLETRPANP